MTRRRIGLAVLLLGVTTGTLMLTGYVSQSAMIQPDPIQCHVTVSGAQRAETMVPTHIVWEVLLRESAGRGGMLLPDLRSETRVQVAAVAVTTLSRVDALRQSLPSRPTAGLPRSTSMDRDLVIADTFVDARDNLLRNVTVDEFFMLYDYVNQVADTVRTELAAPGQVVAQADGTQYCEARIDGREYPHLLPEPLIWSVVFNAWAKALDYNMRMHGQLPEAYLQHVSRTTLRMSFAEIRSFLDIAGATSAEVARLKKEPETQSTAVNIQRAVMVGRYSVLRALSVEGWRALISYVDEARQGITSWYRSPNN